jgi:hypothetical protein
MAVTNAWHAVGVGEPFQYDGDIIGDERICSSSSTFTIENLPALCTVTWNCGPNLTIVSQQGSACTFQSTGNGASFVNVTVNLGCESFSFQKYVWSGIPARPSTISYIHLNGTCYYCAFTGSLQGVVNYLWSENNTIWEAGDNEYGFFEPSTTYQIYVKTQNECGTSLVRSVTKKTPPPPANCMWKTTSSENGNEQKGIRSEMNDALVVYPNPATSQIEVFITDPENAISPESPINVAIYDDLGALIIKKTYTSTSFVINIAGLSPGVYIIRIAMNDQIYNQRFIRK